MLLSSLYGNFPVLNFKSNHFPFSPFISSDPCLIVPYIILSLPHKPLGDLSDQLSADGLSRLRRILFFQHLIREEGEVLLAKSSCSK
jgi:hypothetical protein